MKFKNEYWTWCFKLGKGVMEHVVMCICIHTVPSSGRPMLQLHLRHDFYNIFSKSNVNYV